MKITGIVLLVLGLLCALGLVLTLVLESAPRESGEIAIGFLGNSWSPILATFLISAGVALLVLDRRKKKETIHH